MQTLIVYKKSNYEMYSHSPEEKTREYALSDPDLRKSHEQQAKTLEQVTKDLSDLGIEHKTIYRGDLTSVKGYDLLLVVGGDGTLLNVAHYVKNIDVPVMGINSDPNSSVGFFSYCNSRTFRKIMERIDDAPKVRLTRLEALINGEKVETYALNDIRIAHVDSDENVRYKLKIDGKSIINHKGSPKLADSGLLLCTAAGSTAWMYNEQGSLMPLDSTKMQYHEQGARNSGFGFASEMEIESLTREGKLSIDGKHCRKLFSLSDIIKVRIGPPITLIADLAAKQKDYPPDLVTRRFLE